MKYSLLCLIFMGMALVKQSGYSSNYSPPHYVEIAHNAMQRAQKKILDTYPLQPTGVGEGMMGGVTSITFLFRLDQPLNKADARRLVVTCTEILLAELNNDEELRPHLIAYPFTNKHVTIIVNFFQQNDSIAIHPYPCAVSSANGKLRFSSKEDPDALPYFQTIYETYEEALTIVNGEKPEASPDFT